MPLRRFLQILLIPVLIVLSTGASPPRIPDPASGCEGVGQVHTGNLPGGDSMSLTYTLEPGHYTFAAWATWDLTFLTLTINTPDGVELARDDGPDNNPIVEIGFEEQIEIEVILTGGHARVENVHGAFSFIVASGEGCYEKNPDPAKEILEDYTSVALDFGEEVVYWVYQDLNGENSLVLNYRLEPGDYTVVAETIDEDDDIDMYVRHGDTILYQDEYPDNIPECIIHLSEQTVVSIEIEPWEYGTGNSTKVVVLVTRNAVGKNEEN